LACFNAAAIKPRFDIADPIADPTLRKLRLDWQVTTVAQSIKCPFGDPEYSAQLDFVQDPDGVEGFRHGLLSRADAKTPLWRRIAGDSGAPL
jgi:hypothetical protein